ncbi:MAG: hypothetical protein U0324_24715 [Polyangiales bacterium]
MPVDLTTVEARATELAAALDAGERFHDPGAEARWLAERLIDAGKTDAADALLRALHGWVAASTPALEPALEAYEYLFDRCRAEGTDASLTLLGALPRNPGEPARLLARRMIEADANERDRKALWAVGTRIGFGARVAGELDALLTLARINGRRALMEEAFRALQVAVELGALTSRVGRRMAGEQATMVLAQMSPDREALDEAAPPPEPLVVPFKHARSGRWERLDHGWLGLAEAAARFALDGDLAHAQARTSALSVLARILFRAGKRDELRRAAEEILAIVREVPEEDQHLVWAAARLARGTLLAAACGRLGLALMEPPDAPA